jgi:large subunit ribosomal protein L15
MQLNSLKRKNSRKRSRQVGRGGKRGKTSGRGTKGQSSRSGRKKRPEMRDIIKRLPKLRGRGKSSLKSIQGGIFSVNLSVIDSRFDQGETVSLATLTQKGLVRSSKKYSGVKILSSGELTKKLIFSRCDMSKGAEEKITAAGGKIEDKI